MIVKTPTLVIDKKKVERNIHRMLDKLKKSDIVFRPHFKTHQLPEIGELFSKNGITMITVSSVSMAQKFSDNGWDDITIAFPLNIHEIEDINNLAKSININILIESNLSALKIIKQIDHPIGVFIKIDTGYNRTGLQYDNPEIEKIIESISKSSNCQFKGFLTHAGHTYRAKGKAEILEIMDTSKSILCKLKKEYLSAYPNIINSYGDTPSCSMADRFDGFDEIRPGNFVFYDVMQYHIGSCTSDEIAVAVACPVVAIHPERNELIIYGGGVHLSKENIAANNDFKLFGYIVKFTNTGWSEPISGAYLSSLSQEHGIIKTSNDTINEFKPGDIIGILPIHSCLTANLLNNNYILI